MTEITVSSAVCVFHVIDCSAVRKKQYCQTHILDGFIVNRFGCILVPACRCISSLLSRVISFLGVRPNSPWCKDLNFGIASAAA
jgi:hypothetical protein